MFFKKRIYPMEPVFRRKLPGEPGFFYQVKWDGIRLLAFGEGGKIRLQGRGLLDKTELYPELKVLLQQVRGKSFILDGELIALEGGKPSFYSLMHRERAGLKNAGAMARMIPVYYMVFDLLLVDNSWLIEKPWEKRQEILENQLIENEVVRFTPSYLEAAPLLAAVEEKKMEGVVAKRRDSPYIFGPRRSAFWLKTKVEQVIEAVVGGISLKGKRAASLLLGLEENRATAFGTATGGMLRYIGSVGSGLGEEELKSWYSWGLENRIAVPPFINPPANRGKEFLWVRPWRRVEVAFAEWTPGLKLRAPRLAAKGKRGVNSNIL